MIPCSSRSCTTAVTVTVLALLLLVATLVAPIDGASFTKKKDKDSGGIATARAKIAGKVLTTAVVTAAYNYLPSDASNTKLFPNAALAYVTPWNPAGYERAKTLVRKFTHISPVWLTLEPNGKMDGMHDIDVGWMAAVRAAASAAGTTTLIVPRVYFGGWKGESFHALGRDTVIKTFGDVLLTLCGEHHFDGVVLDFALPPRMLGTIVPLLEHIYPIMDLHGYELIVVLPPMKIHGAEFYTVQELQTVVAHTDYAQVTTYDYSMTTGRPGPIAPYDWMFENVLAMVPADKRGASGASYRNKLMLGINFYGMHYKADGSHDAIRGDEVISLITTEASHIKSAFEWDDSTKEHSISYTTHGSRRNYIYCPTPYFVSTRLELAKEFGLGMGIWEIGQGWESLFAPF